MPDRYWVGVDTNWHLASNWSLTSGGAGGAGIPTASDDVYFDGNGNILCYATSDIVMNNFSMITGATESLLISANAVINGDFLLQAGYFGPTGGPDHTVEFKGDWLTSGGTFAVGTGTGKDPECIFSGTDKTYANNGITAASFQNVLVSGTLTMSGTKLGQMAITQKLSITGTLTVNKNGLITICNIDLNGVNAGFDIFTGELAGTGRLYWRYREAHSIPLTGTISIKYFRLRIEEPGSGNFDEDLPVDGWTNVNQDWTHEGASPFLDDDEDVNKITLPCVAGSVGLFDEEYSIGDLPSDFLTATPTKVKVHFKAKLVDGVGGHPTLVALRGWIWDGSIWQDGGTCYFNSTSYVDQDCSTSLHASIDTLAKLNAMKIKVELDFIIGEGADKGDIEVTYAYVEVEGTKTWSPIVTVAPRTFAANCTVEFEYTDVESTFRLEAGRHYFLGPIEILGNDAVIDVATFDCDTNMAEMWVGGIFDVDNNAFPSAIFNLLLGDGIHVFRGTVDLFFAYSSGLSSSLVVDPGDGTIILWPAGLRAIPLPPP